MDIKSLFVLGTVSTIYGCSNLSPLTQEVYDAHLVKSFDAPKKECYDATKNALDELGYVVAKESLEKGKLITKRKEVTGQESRYSLAGEHKQTYDVNIAYKYYFTVSNVQDDSCEVRVDRFRAWYKGKEVKEVNIPYINEHQWLPVFTEIDEKLSYDI